MFVSVMANQMNWPGCHCGHTLQVQQKNIMFQFCLCVDSNVEAKIDIFLCKVFLFFDF